MCTSTHVVAALLLSLLLGCAGTLPGTESTTSSSMETDGTMGDPSGPIPSVKCGADLCNADMAPVCCYVSGNNTAMCVSNIEACSGSYFTCDDQSDCRENEVCCAVYDATKGVASSACVDKSTGCSDPSNYDPNSLEMCTGNSTCQEGYACVDSSVAFPGSPEFFEFCRLVPYGPCVTDGGLDGECLLDGNQCYVFAIEGVVPKGYVCTQACYSSQDCPVPNPSPGANPVCIQNDCYLDCTDQDDSACPRGMRCLKDINFPLGVVKDICAW